MAVMASLQAARLVPARARRKDPLPVSRSRRGEDLALDRFRDTNGTESVPDRPREWYVPARADDAEGVWPSVEAWCDDHGDPSGRERESVRARIDILDAQHQTFQQMEAGAIQQQRNEMRGSGHPGQQAPDCGCHHDRQARRPRRTHDVLQPRRRIVEYVAIKGRT